MGDHKLAWILGIVTVVYLIAMILLFWRYRRAMDQLSDKMRECHEKRRQKNLTEAQIQQTEGITAIYRKPDAPEPEEVPETETEETPETKSSSLNLTDCAGRMLLRCGFSRTNVIFVVQFDDEYGDFVTIGGVCAVGE